jgi:fused signal recognition particle receptor
MQSDPFEYLQNAGHHINTWILVGGPLAIFTIIAIVLFFYVQYRRSQEKRRLDAELRSPAAQALKSDDLGSTDQASVDVDAATATFKDSDQDSLMIVLRRGLSRTRDAIAGGLGGLFLAGAKIDEHTLEKMHEILYRADVGVAASDRLVASVRSKLSGQTVDWPVLKNALIEAANLIFADSVRPVNIPGEGLYVLLIIGVNGVGKTTTIGKLAARFKADGKKVMLCAADTFRAAAIEQLTVWGERNDIPVIKQHQGADPAAVAFDGVQAAKARGADVLIIDTAGRLHNKNDLMAELSKIHKSISKGYEGAPHETWIVVDATTGQNAVQQVKSFSEVTNLSGIVVTKLDGTAKGGVIIGIADEFKIPIRYIGVGETAADLRAFESSDFMHGLLES